MVTGNVGPYAVLAKLGEGGMGEVYRARDTRLDREVALKVLPSSFAGDPDRLFRFEREAKTLAALNHPHIAQVFGIEQQSTGTGVTRAIIMELVEGETLADRIARGALPLDDALPIARQIADALAAAHDAGIVHRDLKPANIKVRPDGTVKVLDFGLAKSVEQDPGASTPHSLENSPTITSPATAAGTIIGTAAYMSPEQARGRAVDRRADSWAFGCVLYEMVTGRRAFDGHTVSDVLAAVMRDAPALDALPADTPASVRRLLRRCLDKDRARRLDSMRDARLDLDDPDTGGAGTTATSQPVSHHRPAAWLVAVTLAAIPLVAGLGYLLGRRVDTTAAPLRVEVGLEPAVSLGPSVFSGRPARHSFVVTSDGRTIVFAGAVGATRQLYARSLDGSEARAIAGTEGAQTPFVSPDDRWIGFLADGAIRKVPRAGGPVVSIADLSAVDVNTPSPLVGRQEGDFFGASWGQDDVIVFGRYGDGLWQVSANGGTPTRLTIPKTGSHRHPRHLPGDQGILLTIVRSDLNAVGVLPRGASEPRVLIERASDARYVASSHIVFVSEGVLTAAPFDLDRLTMTGPPFPIEQNVMVAAGSGGPAANTMAAQYDVSRSGTLVFATGGSYPPRPSRLSWVDRSGRIEPLHTSTGGFSRPRLSPDGRRVAVTVSAASPAEPPGIYIADLERGSKTQLTRDGEWGPLWSADGSHVMFMSDPGMGRMPADGSGPIERLLDEDGFPHAVTRDGLLIFGQRGVSSGADIWTMKLDGDRAPKPLLSSPANEAWAEVSPDGRWIAYGSDSSGRSEVYVQPFPGLGRREQISTGGGDSPLWSRNGRELFFLSARDGQIDVNAVDVGGSDALEFGKPRRLFSGQFGRTGSPTAYDVAPDGGRFLMTEWLDAPHQPVARLRVVFNWFEELRRAERLSK